MIDGVLEFEDRIYLLEFKYGPSGTDMDSLTEAAIQQIQQKGSAERYHHDPRQRIVLGIGFLDREIGYKLDISWAEMSSSMYVTHQKIHNHCHGHYALSDRHNVSAPSPRP